ncbi:MAG: hypothetical protein EU549_00570, partial [Promethearchaeota archaeon]
AAGGIADAHGFLSALMMGASAICLGTLLMSTEECPASKRFKKTKLVEREGYNDEKFYKKIYHLSLRDSPVPSMSVCLINDIVPMKERIGRIIKDADKILKDWGFSSKILDLT